MAQTNFGGVLVVDPTTGIGYTTGAGGTVTQSSNKSTAVTLDKASGQITTNNASIGTGAIVGFTLTNAAIAATDVIALSFASGGSTNSYVGFVDAVAAGSCHIMIQNISGAPIAQAVVINYAVIKGASA